MFKNGPCQVDWKVWQIRASWATKSMMANLVCDCQKTSRAKKYSSKLWRIVDILSVLMRHDDFTNVGVRMTAHHTDVLLVLKVVISAWVWPTGRLKVQTYRQRVVTNLLCETALTIISSKLEIIKGWKNFFWIFIDLYFFMNFFLGRFTWYIFNFAIQKIIYRT